MKFDRPPETLNKNVVVGTPVTVHADHHLRLLQGAHERIGREMADLGTVENLRASAVHRIPMNPFISTTALLYFALISFSRMGGGAVSPLVVTDNIGGAFRCGAL